MRERVESPWTLFGPLSATRGAAGARRAPAHEYSIGNATAGLFAGDHLASEIRLLQGASVRITSPSATYAFAMGGGGASQSVRIELAAGAELEYAPGPLIPFARSNVMQSTEFTLPGSASLRARDTILLGRIDHGEIASFHRLHSSVSIEVDGELLICDALSIDTSRTPRGSLVRAWDGRCALGTLYVAGRLAREWRVDRDGLRNLAARAAEANVRLGVTRPDERLVAARALGPYPAAVEAALSALEELALGGSLAPGEAGTTASPAPPGPAAAASQKPAVEPAAGGKERRRPRG